jgi:hypothetical protein
MACAMSEPPAQNSDLQTADAAVSPGPADVPIRSLIALTLPVSLLGSAASAASFLAQTSGHGEPGRMSVLIAVVTLAEAAGAALAMRAAAAGVTTMRTLFGLGAICACVAVVMPGCLHAGRRGAGRCSTASRIRSAPQPCSVQCPIRCGRAPRHSRRVRSGDPLHDAADCRLLADAAEKMKYAMTPAATNPSAKSTPLAGADTNTYVHRTSATIAGIGYSHMRNGCGTSADSGGAG